jgi:hypothetical protein
MLVLSGFVVYDLVNLFILPLCGLAIQIWLFLIHCLVISMKLMLSAIENKDQDDPLTRRLFKVLYLVLFPLLIGWTVLGTLLFMDTNSEDRYCVSLYINLGY